MQRPTKAKAEKPSPTPGAPNGFNLSPTIGSFMECPHHLRVPFIHHGYRLNHSLYNHCIQSLFSLHNETFNIWTHLLACVFFTYMAYFSCHNFDAHHGWILFIYNVSAAFCFLGSTLFHSFNCVDLHHYHFLRRVDFCGISSLIVASTWVIMFYTFACQEFELKFYAYLFSLPSVIALLIPFMSFFQHERYRWARVAIYVGLAISSLLFGLHLSLKHGLFSTIVLTAWYPTLLSSYLAYGVGVTIYSSRFPEKLYPGKFDIFFASHQIWHVFVFVATYIMYYSFSVYVPIHSANECHELLGLDTPITSENQGLFN